VNTLFSRQSSTESLSDIMGGPNHRRPTGADGIEEWHGSRRGSDVVEVMPGSYRKPSFVQSQQQRRSSVIESDILEEPAGTKMEISSLSSSQRQSFISLHPVESKQESIEPSRKLSLKGHIPSTTTPELELLPALPPSIPRTISGSSLNQSFERLPNFTNEDDEKNHSRRFTFSSSSHRPSRPSSHLVIAGSTSAIVSNNLLGKTGQNSGSGQESLESITASHAHMENAHELPANDNQTTNSQTIPANNNDIGSGKDLFKNKPVASVETSKKLWEPLGLTSLTEVGAKTLYPSWYAQENKISEKFTPTKSVNILGSFVQPEISMGVSLNLNMNMKLPNKLRLWKK
jgi:hypothetical protein